MPETRPSVDEKERYKVNNQHLTEEQRRDEIEKKYSKLKEDAVKQIEERLENSLERMCGFFNT